MKKLIKITLIVTGLILLLESCGPTPACGNRAAHRARTAKMKKQGMWM